MHVLLFLVSLNLKLLFYLKNGEAIVSIVRYSMYSGNIVLYTGVALSQGLICTKRVHLELVKWPL